MSYFARRRHANHVVVASSMRMRGCLISRGFTSGYLLDASSTLTAFRILSGPQDAEPPMHSSSFVGDYLAAVVEWDRF